MKKMKYLTIILCMFMLLFLIPSISNAETGVTVTRDVYSNNGSMKFTFTGLTLDTTHEYEYGLTKTSAATVETWYSILEPTATTATVDIVTTNTKLREVINATDTGYITIKDKTASTVVLPAYAVDLKTPYLLVTNYTVINNGKTFGEDSDVHVALRNANNVTVPKYQYEKITDESLINKYKEIKAKNGDFLELESMIKTALPTSGWTTWTFWNGYDSSTGMNGYGCPQRTVSVPDTGLYYMWLEFAGKNVKNMYGVILVDNLQPDIALESVSLPKTEKVELGKTITLTPTFNPEGATNKIVTWSSSDETVAIIDNAGKITPIKLGSTIITATSQDGAKKATCAVTVVTSSNGSGNSGAGTSGTGTKGDGTISNSKIPQTGENITVIVGLVLLVGLGVVLYFKNKQYKEIK